VELADAGLDVAAWFIVIRMNAAEFAASLLAPSTPVPLPPPEPGVLVPGMMQPVIVVVAGWPACGVWALNPDCVCAAAVAPAATAMMPANK
jgi:hypothetical protein